MESNKDKIQAITLQMLSQAIPQIEKNIEKALKSGAIDVDGWSENNNPMILPKIILVAAMEEEADQYKASGTSFEKQVKKEINNLKLLL